MAASRRSRARAATRVDRRLAPRRARGARRPRRASRPAPGEELRAARGRTAALLVTRRLARARARAAARPRLPRLRPDRARSPAFEVEGEDAAAPPHRARPRRAARRRVDRARHASGDRAHERRAASGSSSRRSSATTSPRSCSTRCEGAAAGEGHLPRPRGCGGRAASSSAATTS